jgi:hypothetical protein
MMLQVCADESYRLDDGGAKVIAIGGWLSRPDNFQGFCQYWEEVLKAYKVEYFHFNEFADRKHLYYPNTPYDGWDDVKREDFLFDLALVACEVGVPLGACVSPNTEADTETHLIIHAYKWFFAGVQKVMKEKFDPGDTVDFIFDENNNPIWEIVTIETLKAFKKNGAPFGNRGYQDDKLFIPLQAADLYVYAMRQNAERFYKKNREPGQPRLLDLILEKNRPDVENWKFHWKNWERLMRKVIAHYRQWKKSNPNEKYYPQIHCPLLQKNEP